METPFDECSKDDSSEIKEIVDYLVDLVVAVVPFPEKPSAASHKTELITIGGIGDVNSADEATDSDIELIEIGSDCKDNEDVENLTCEVSFDADIVKSCLICEAEGDFQFQVYDQGKVEFLCSQECLKVLRKRKNLSCYQCKDDISISSQGYLSNFGPDKAAFCSEQCLLKFETENEPVSKCFECNAYIEKSGKNAIVYYWQTMEFCSIQCVVNLQYFLGEKCAYCKKKISKVALGKYSVRFGDVIKQFCDGNCLEFYKKGLRFCAFCQKDLKGSTSVLNSVFASGDRRKSREFCDTICKNQYESMVSSKSSSNLSSSTSSSSIDKNGSSSGTNGLSVGCDQCQRIINKSAMTTINYNNQNFHLCGSTCIAAFKYSHDINAIVCENCYSFDWPLSSLTPLHYSGIVKLFCSKKCLNMYVLKNRKIVSCLNCKVKKYDFDLIEKYECETNNSRMFCSLNCLNIYKTSIPQVEDVSDKKTLCDYCRKSASSSFRLTTDGVTKNFCSQLCMKNQQITFVTCAATFTQPTKATTVTSPSPLVSSASNVKTTTVNFVDNKICLQPRQQSPIMKTATTPSQNSIRFVAPSNITLTPATVASKMWTPSFASMQPGNVTVSSTLTKPVVVTTTVPTILQRKITSTVLQPSTPTTTTTTSTTVRPTVPATATVSTPVTVVTLPAKTTAIASTKAPVTTSTRTTTQQILLQEVPLAKQAVKERIVVKQPPPKSISNKTTMFRASSKSKAVGCKPLMFDKSAQVDEVEQVDQKPVMIPVPIPVPIPIFIPTPFAYPEYLPFPFPVPVPLFFQSEEARKTTKPKPYSSEIQNQVCDDLFPELNFSHLVECEAAEDSFPCVGEEQKRESYARAAKRKASEKLDSTSTPDGSAPKSKKSSDIPNGETSETQSATTATKSEVGPKLRRSTARAKKRVTLRPELFRAKPMNENSNSSSSSVSSFTSSDSKDFAQVSKRTGESSAGSNARENSKNNSEGPKGPPAGPRRSERVREVQIVSSSSDGESNEKRLRDRNRTTLSSQPHGGKR